jgi:hypothetical protein
VNPFSAAIENCIAYMMQSNVAVVIASNCEYRGDPANTINEFAQIFQLRNLIDKVTSQKDSVRCCLLDSCDDLISKIS